MKLHSLRKILGDICLLDDNCSLIDKEDVILIPLEEKKNLEKAIVSTWAKERKNPFDNHLSYKEIN